MDSKLEIAHIISDAEEIKRELLNKAMNNNLSNEQMIEIAVAYFKCDYYKEKLKTIP
jgi:hypothetical protein